VILCSYLEYRIPVNQRFKIRKGRTGRDRKVPLNRSLVPIKIGFQNLGLFIVSYSGQTNFVSPAPLHQTRRFIGNYIPYPLSISSRSDKILRSLVLKDIYRRGVDTPTLATSNLQHKVVR